jgi:hypothetical protein
MLPDEWPLSLQVVFLRIFTLLQLSILQTLEQWDQWLFIKLNSALTNPVFDNIALSPQWD